MFGYFFLLSVTCSIGVFCGINAGNSSHSLSVPLGSFNYCLVLQNLSFKELAKNRLVTVSTSLHLIFFSLGPCKVDQLFSELHIKNSWRKNSICLVNISSVGRQCQILSFFKKKFKPSMVLSEQWKLSQMWRRLDVAILRLSRPSWAFSPVHPPLCQVCRETWHPLGKHVCLLVCHV